MKVQLVNVVTEKNVGRAIRLKAIPYPTEHIIIENESNGDRDFYAVNFPEVVIKKNFITKILPFFYFVKVYIAVTHIRHNGVNVDNQTPAQRIKQKKQQNSLKKMDKDKDKDNEGLNISGKESETDKLHI